MPNLRQSRAFWLKWIDRQYAKADPTHVKMHVDLWAKEGEAGNEIIDGSDAGDRRQERQKNEPPPYTNVPKFR
jgi:hypothetical protein